MNKKEFEEKFNRLKNKYKFYWDYIIHCGCFGL
jgi:hypothetical protein